MSETGSKPTNGEVDWAQSKELGAFLPRPTPEAESPYAAAIVNAVRITPSEPIEPEKLYEFYSARTRKLEVEGFVAIVSRVALAVLERLRQALRRESELEKENEVGIAIEVFGELSRFVGISPALDEALSMLLVAIGAHHTMPYSRKELVALESVFEKLRRRPIPTAEDLASIYEALDTAGFDMNAPLAGVDLNENE